MFEKLTEEACWPNYKQAHHSVKITIYYWCLVIEYANKHRGQPYNELTCSTGSEKIIALRKDMRSTQTPDEEKFETSKHHTANQNV